MSMTLYEIDERLVNLLELEGEIVDVETGEVVTMADIEALEMARADKIEGWGLWIKNKTAELEAIKAEIESLAARAKALSGKIDGSKRRYQQYLGGQKVSTPRLSVTYRKSQAVEITDEEAIPPTYMREIPATYAPDKVALKDALKSGQEIPGCYLDDRVSMTIK